MFSVYVHVPFCARRCGYCDFNTYTAKELGGGATQAGYPGLAIQEIDLAAEHLRAVGSEPREVDTVFFGGGTPTILPSSSLLKILKHIDRTWGLAPNAEITTEANPDSVTERSINELAAGGITRISLGMQSAVPHVLRTLDRTHDPEQVARAVGWAKAAGLAVSLDLIYGTPGESLTDWKRSVEIALALDIPHLSAYALQVEPHTKMGRQIARGLLPAPDDDDAAAKYELADSLFAEAGLEWYEISNWAKGGINGPNACRHNLAYWRGQSWWGIGPGSHSYLAPAQPNLPLPSPPHSPPSVSITPAMDPIAGVIDTLGGKGPLGELDESDGFAGGTMATGPNGFGVRWWNVRHPIKYAELIAQNRFPIEGQERLTADQAQLERVMLALRLADGLPVEALESTQRHAEPIDFIPPQAVLSYPVFSESSSPDPLRAFSASNSSQPQPQPSSAVVSAASASSSSSSKNPQREIAQLIADGLIEGRAAIADRVIVLTRKGRLLADTVTRRLT